jgi:hypothetical protein
MLRAMLNRPDLGLLILRVVAGAHLNFMSQDYSVDVARRSTQ